MPLYQTQPGAILFPNLIVKLSNMFYAFTGLLNAISCSIVGIFVYSRNRRSIVNKTFGLFCFFISFWSYSYFFWQISSIESKALFWSRILMFGAIFIPVSYLHFVFALTQETRKNTRKIILFFGYFISFLFFLANFTSWFVVDVRPRLNFKFWPTAGPIYTPFLLFWFSYAFYSLILLLKAYKKSAGTKRSQLSYVFLGTICGYLGGATNYFLWYDIPLPPLGNWAITLYAFLVAYGIIKYRLMDIRFVLGRTAVYLLSFTTILVLALGLMFFNEALTVPISAKIVYSGILIISILLFQPIFRFFEIIASKHFYYTFYSYQKVITELSRKLVTVLNLEKLNDLIVETLIKTMQLDKTGILLRNEKTGIYGIQKIIGFKEENGISLVKDNFLTEWLEQTKKPLVYEELELIIKDAKTKEEQEALKNLRENMKSIEANLCLPLFREEKITGIVVLGKKISREPYSEQDIELLTALSNQASIALENSKLYEEIQDLSQNLQRKVDEQTKDVQEAYEVEKRARKELERLNEAKNQFIMATQHHLRTPLTAMRGYIDLLLTGSYGKLPQKIKEPIKRFEVSTNRLLRIANELLDISQFQLGREVVSPQPNIDVMLMIKEIVEELKFEAEMKHIYLKLKKSEGKVPLINADPEKLKVALFNFVDNSVKYTNKGGVIVGVELSDHKILITIKDTGIGISKEDLETLFGRIFERSKEAQKTHVTGRGIGLFITDHIIKSHKGRVWAESEGLGKGSSFYIELPV